MLENWKDAELYKLCRTAANAEATLNYLKVINRYGKEYVNMLEYKQLNKNMIESFLRFYSIIAFIRV